MLHVDVFSKGIAPVKRQRENNYVYKCKFRIRSGS